VSVSGKCTTIENLVVDMKLLISSAECQTSLDIVE